jgi:hypothetical protein
LLESIWEQNRNDPNVFYFERGDVPASVEATAQWLVENNIIHSYHLDGDRLLIKKGEKAPEIAIENAGTGLARTFAVANLCFAAPPGATLLFEQPDRGVHNYGVSVHFLCLELLA